MKYTLIGDPHITPKNLDKANKLFKLVESMGLTTIWLGDFLDTKELIRGNCLNLLYNSLKKSKLNHIIIIGNHDWFNLEGKEHSLEVLKELPNVKIIDKPTNLANMWFFPYIHDKPILKKEIKKAFTKKPESVLIGHFDITSFDYGNGYLCQDGLEVKDFNKIPTVISGHFHKFQQKSNILYLGTPFSHSFGETNQDKFVGILDSDTSKVELKLTDFSKHLTIEVDCDKPFNISDLSIDESKNDHIRIVLTGKRDNIDKFSKEDLKDLNIKFIEKPNDIIDNKVLIKETLSNSMQFEIWARDIAKLNKDTIKTGMSYLK